MSKKELWEQQEDESKAWFERFGMYCAIEDSDRSVEAAYNEFCLLNRRKRSPVALSSWVKKAEEYQWPQRAKARDYQHKRQKEKSNVDFYDKVRHEMQKRVTGLLERADQMLAMPLTEQYESDEDDNTIIIKPVGFNADTVPKYLTTAANLTKFMIEHGLHGSGTAASGPKPFGQSPDAVGGAPAGVIKATRVEPYEEMSNEALLSYVLSFCGESAE